MSIDFERHLAATSRTVTSLERDGQPARAVILSRTYDTDADDLWDAIVTPERLKRWFLPVTGDLKLGGRYQLQGNAGGTITTCDAPKLLALTWEFGGGMSWVDVALAAESANATRLTLTHTAHLSDHWTTYGPGAVGVGWDLGLAAFAAYLADPAIELNEAMLSATPEGKRFIRALANDWGRADIAGGEAPAQANKAATATGDFYTGETSTTGG